MRRTLVAVPCYNEAARLDLAAWRDFAGREPSVGFVFVDDGSTDGTAALLAGLCRDAPEAFDLCSLDRNRGKAEAVRRGVLRALERRPEYVGYWDADLATPLETIPAFVGLLEERPDLDLVMGARVRLLGRRIERSAMRHYLGRVFATAASWTLRLPVYDTQCGAKLFRASPSVERAFAEPFRTNWTFDVEVLARLASEGSGQGETPRTYGIYEYPLPAWRDVAGSKVRPWDFVKALGGLAAIGWAIRRAERVMPKTPSRPTTTRTG